MLLLILLSFLRFSSSEECWSRYYISTSTVCVCNASYCDTLPKIQPVEAFRYLRYTSNKAGLRFFKEEESFGEGPPVGTVITVDTSERYQSILGWGGAFTDATGINIASLSEDLQENLLKSYFSDDGLEYNMARVPIGGTDFSTRGYSYDDGPEDMTLDNFALTEEDYRFKIPYILRAKNLSSEDLHLFASAWTAPKWMKTNGEYWGFGFLKTKMYQTWVDYFIKFLDAYAEQGLNFWGLTTGNEPSIVYTLISSVNSVGWTSSQQRNWIVNYLTPTIRKSKHKDLKIIFYDDLLAFLPWFAQEVTKPVKVIPSTLSDNITRDSIDGIAVHWYLNNFFLPSKLTETHNLFPTKFILGTEAATSGPVQLGSWEKGEMYSVDIIQDLQNWVTGWIDWNMALDNLGMPTYVGNRVDAPLIVNSTADEIYKQPMYYHLGHFTKFLPRNSIRIKTVLSGGQLQVVGFQRPDNGTVLIILNSDYNPHEISVVDSTRGTASMLLTGRSITSLVYW